VGWHAHLRRCACDDGLSGCPCSPTLPAQGQQLGRPPLRLSYVDGIENGLLPCAREAPATDPCFGGGGASRRGSRCDPGAGTGNQASQNCTRQPGSCSDKRYRGPPVAHCCQLGPHGHHHVVHSDQQKLVDAATHRGGTMVATPGWGWTQAATPAATPAGIRGTRKPCPQNYCWTHGHRVGKHHMSATCANKAPGHPGDATASNTLGGSNKDKNWNAAHT
jgi:hypothetical protein